jgi:uncharacterized protein YvpB
VRSKLWLIFIFGLLVISYPLISGLSSAKTAGQGKPIRFLEKITDQTTVIKGTASPNAAIKAETKDGVLNRTQADGAGKFALAIAKQPGHSILKITAGNRNHKRSVNVTVTATGWVHEGGRWYFYNSKGEKQTGWIQNQGHYYFLNHTGVLQTGWLHDNGHWYYLNSSGVMQTGWVKVSGKNYYLNSQGVMQTGWIQNSKGKFYLGTDGSVSSVILDAPLVTQLPELPRGCEVTSLTMMLQSAGVPANKMTLAAQVPKDPTPYSRVNGQIHYGNPNKGFVGDMYNMDNLGYGVYHGPIAKLAKTYLPNRVIDFTGSRFETMFQFLNEGKPVWVIIDTLFDAAPPKDWVVWKTPEGTISINGTEHSVLVTGYDSQYIYFNDPLSGEKNDRAAIHSFKSGWEQMGSQAISYR